MIKYNEASAMKTAVELAKVNLESTSGWVAPATVNHFIEEVYSLLTGEEKSE